MKIGELDMHCGNCNITQYCGNPYGKAICCDSRFGNVEESIYNEIVEKIPNVFTLVQCKNCDDNECETCDYGDELADFKAERIADYVYEQLKKGDNDGK